MKRRIAIVVTAIMMICFLTSCGESPSSSGGSAATATSAAGSAHYDLTLGTAGTSGTYYIVGAALADTINNLCPNLTVVAQATNGGVENLNLILSGQMEMGFTNADAAYWSSHGGGTGYYKAYANPGDIQGVMRLYQSEGHMVVKGNSPIKTYADLKGKKVCLGPPSSTIPAMSIAILEEYGIDPEKDITPVYYSIDEGLEKLKDGVIDATFMVGSAPIAGLISASSTTNLKFVDADEGVLKKVVEKYPYYEIIRTKDGAYPKMNTVNTLKIYTEICAGANVPDEAVYQFVKTVLENQSKYVNAHVACKEIVPETAWQCSATLHPGAERYYREKGLVK